LHLRKCITLVIEVIILFIRVTVRAITVGIPRSSRGLAAICHVKFSDRAEGHCWCNLCALHSAFQGGGAPILDRDFATVLPGSPLGERVGPPGAPDPGQYPALCSEVTWLCPLDLST